MEAVERSGWKQWKEVDGSSRKKWIEAVKRSIPIILHAHGDNISSWRNLLEIAVNIPNPPRIVLTHQTSEKIDGMHNPGGFTDGDRAICFLTALGVPNERILLLGTRTDIVGKWSGKTNPEEKLMKLQWMAKVIDIIGVKY